LSKPEHRKAAFGVKVVTVSPDNNAIGKPAVMGLYLLLDGKTGEPRALIDGQRLTQWRTACASALAADYLARRDASKLLVWAPARLSLRFWPAPIRRCGRSARSGSGTAPPANAEKVAPTLRADGLDATATPILARRSAGPTSCRRRRSRPIPLVEGAKLKPGVHVDLVGGFTPTMREADDEAIRRARVYVDTRAGATKEAGDIVQPLASGVLAPEAIVADLHELARGEKRGPSGR
jgi:ornithine cyclodeaminase/alanine dehydrogenase-like protein (mu-crystallin family)